jgi:hypothetical protein
MYSIYSIKTFLNEKAIRLKTEHMCKYVLCLVIIFLFSISIKVSAQQRGSLWVNVISGINNTWIINQNAYGNQEVEYSSAFGMTGGVGMSYFYNRKWGFNGSMLASKLGQNYKGYQAGAIAKRNVKLLYLEIPLLIMKGVPGMEYPTWISFGPDVMILLNAKQEYSRDGGSPLPNPEGMIVSDTKERFNIADVAVNLSLNRMYALNYSRKLMLLISLNSAVGLTDINKSAWHIPNTHDVYGRSHNFYVGMKIGLMYKVRVVGGRRW